MYLFLYDPTKPNEKNRNPNWIRTTFLCIASRRSEALTVIVSLTILFFCHG
jgi:hypothetical protein